MDSFILTGKHRLCRLARTHQTPLVTILALYILGYSTQALAADDHRIAAAVPHADAEVAADGSAQYRTLQAAIDAAPTDHSSPWTIFVHAGRYLEQLHVPAHKSGIILRGESATTTVVTSNTNIGTLDAQGRKLSTPESATVLIEGDDFFGEDITFENTTTQEQHIQALAMYVTGDRVVFRRCRFLGWQDTLRLDSPRPPNTEPDTPRPRCNSRQYLVDCYVEGYVDFIYSSGTAVFDRCHIHCKADGYITAASTPADVPFGYVFLDCVITTGPGVDHGVYLGRPWRKYAAVIFIRSKLPEKIFAAGWDNWGNADNEKTARFAEFGSSGPGANPNGRVSWAKQLTADEASHITPARVLAGRDGWNPAR